MRNKPILIAIVMVSSSLAGCTSDNSEEDLSARYQEGYDAGYGDAYDASYDGVAQHHYNEGWDDGWEIANSDSQAEIMELQELASGLNQTIQSLLGEINDLQELTTSLNGTIQSLQNQLNVPLIDCGVGTTLSNLVCVSDSVVWGRLPFEQGTNLTINQAFMGGFTHHGDGMYAVDFSMDEGTPVVSFKPGVIMDIRAVSYTHLTQPTKRIV